MRRERDRKGALEEMGETLGETAGRAAGQAADSAMDLAGSFLDSAFRSLGQWWTDAGAGQAARSFTEHDRECKAHFAASRASDADPPAYDSVRPLYQLGHVAGRNPEFRGRSFAEVERELERVWLEDGGTRYGTWTEVREYVSFGYSRGSAVLRGGSAG